MIKLIKSNWRLLSGIGVVGISLLPILFSGLYSDDLPNFQFRQSLPENNLGEALGRAQWVSGKWMELGRFTPLSFYWMEVVFSLCKELWVYKGLIFLMNLLAVLIFLRLIQAMVPGMNKTLWLLGYAAVIQFRIGYHDPFTSLNGLYQLLAVFIFSSLYFLAGYVRHKKPHFIILSVLFYILAILTSEVGLMILLLIPFLCYVLKLKFRESITPLILFGLVSGLYLVYIFQLRSAMAPGQGYEGLRVNLGLPAMAGVFVKQLFSSLPLTNIIEKRAIFSILFHQFSLPENWGFLLFLTCGVILLTRQPLVNSIYNTNANKGAWALFSLALMIIPVLFLVPSVKYQNELSWGNGYLPVFIQNFGSASLLALLIGRYLPKIAGRIKGQKATFVILLSLILSINFLYNRSQISAKNFCSATPAGLLYESVDKGALDSIEAGSLIILANDYYYKNPDGYQRLFLNLTQKHFRVVDSPYVPHADTPGYLLVCKPGREIHVGLFPVDSSGIRWDRPLVNQVYSNPVKLIPEEIYPDRYLD